MVRALTALLVLLPAPQDDPELARKVKALLEQVASDDVQASDDALSDLIKLGPPALPLLSAELAKAGGDLKLRIEAAIKQIQRRARRDKAMGLPLAVTMKAEKKPLAEALEELKRASGQPIAFKDLPAGDVTVRFDKTPFWEALDGLCKAHGGVMWRARGTEIVVEARPWRDVPKVIRGNVVAYLDRLTATTYVPEGASSPSLSITGAVAWVKGAKPAVSSLGFDELADDKGTELIQRDNGFTVYGGVEEAEPGDLISRPLNYWNQAIPAEGAETLAKCKGSVKVKYVLERQKVLSVAHPAEARGTTQPAGSVTVTIKEVTIGETQASIAVDIRGKGESEDLGVGATDFTLVDTAGKTYAARGENQGWSMESGGEGSWTTLHLRLVFALPAKVEIASLDLTAATDTEEVVLPFDFKGLSIK